MQEEIRPGDQELVRMYEEGDEEAIRQTDRRYGAELFRLSYRILASREDSEENRNDTYLKTWQTIPPIKPHSLRAYLLKICRNLALDRLDRRKARKRGAEIVELTEEMEECIPDTRAGDQMDAYELREIIQRFLDQLPRDQRNILVRRCFLMEPARVIASDFGFTEGKVNTILWRTRQKLKTYLEREGVWI